MTIATLETRSEKKGYKKSEKGTRTVKPENRTEPRNRAGDLDVCEKIFGETKQNNI